MIPARSSCSRSTAPTHGWRSSRNWAVEHPCLLTLQALDCCPSFAHEHILRTQQPSGSIATCCRLNRSMVSECPRASDHPLRDESRYSAGASRSIHAMAVHLHPDTPSLLTTLHLVDVCSLSADDPDDFRSFMVASPQSPMAMPHIAAQETNEENHSSRSMKIPALFSTTLATKLAPQRDAGRPQYSEKRNMSTISRHTPSIKG